MTSRPTILYTNPGRAKFEKYEIAIFDRQGNDSLYSEEQKEEIKKKNTFNGVHIYPLTDPDNMYKYQKYIFKLISEGTDNNDMKDVVGEKWQFNDTIMMNDEMNDKVEAAMAAVVGGRKKRKTRRKTRRGGKRKIYRVKAVKAWLKRTKRRRKKRKTKKKKKKRRRRTRR